MEKQKFKSTLVWNAGQAYQDYGHIIGAVYHGPGKVFFRDFSRSLNCDLLGVVPRLMGYEPDKLQGFLKDTITNFYCTGWYTPTSVLAPKEHERLIKIILDAEDEEVRNFLARPFGKIPKKLK